jgi:hypothetical protein
LSFVFFNLVFVKAAPVSADYNAPSAAPVDYSAPAQSVDGGDASYSAPSDAPFVTSGNYNAPSNSDSSNYNAPAQPSVNQNEFLKARETYYKFKGQAERYGL